MATRRSWLEEALVGDGYEMDQQSLQYRKHGLTIGLPALRDIESIVTKQIAKRHLDNKRCGMAS